MSERDKGKCQKKSLIDDNRKGRKGKSKKNKRTGQSRRNRFENKVSSSK